MSDQTPGAPPPETFPREYVEELRREAGNARTKLKAAEAKLAAGGGEEKDATIKGLKTQLALKGNRHGVDPQIAAYMLREKLTAFDPDGEDAGETLDEWMDGLVGEHPELKKVSPPARSGGEFKGPAQVSDQLSRRDLQAMRPEEVAAAMQAGRFNQLLGRQR